MSIKDEHTKVLAALEAKVLESEKRHADLIKESKEKEIKQDNGLILAKSAEIEKMTVEVERLEVALDTITKKLDSSHAIVDTKSNDEEVKQMKHEYEEMIVSKDKQIKAVEERLAFIAQTSSSDDNANKEVSARY
ncbi:hypothetical protein CLU79DRAFT_372090 [Phycomyces nitens]|nr:hypothetical protein CLU79DRAFT_372090 [Phycomyces nitens]